MAKRNSLKTPIVSSVDGINKPIDHRGEFDIPSNSFKVTGFNANPSAYVEISLFDLDTGRIASSAHTWADSQGKWAVSLSAEEGEYAIRPKQFSGGDQSSPEYYEFVNIDTTDPTPSHLYNLRPYEYGQSNYYRVDSVAYRTDGATSYKVSGTSDGTTLHYSTEASAGFPRFFREVEKSADGNYYFELFNPFETGRISYYETDRAGNTSELKQFSFEFIDTESLSTGMPPEEIPLPAFIEQHHSKIFWEDKAEQGWRPIVEYTETFPENTASPPDPFAVTITDDWY